MIPENRKKGFDFDPIDLPGLIVPQAPLITPPPLTGIPVSTPDTGEESIIEALYQKMKKKGDFPTFSRQIIDVNRIIATDKSSPRDISNVIMRDFSLTNKLIKLVNSAMYSQFNQNGVSSVASAMMIMGTNQIQRTASSLMLFEHMKNNAENQQLKDITLLTYMSGLMAKDIAGLDGYKDQEEFQICGMFHKLGENLVSFYFPEKLRLILEIVNKRGLSRDEAARKILGIDFKSLGAGVAKKWGLPANIIGSMMFDPESLSHEKGRRFSRIERLGGISSFSNALCDIHRNPSPERRNSAILNLLDRFSGVVDLGRNDVDNLVKRVAERMKSHAGVVNIPIAHNEIIANMDGSAQRENKVQVSAAQPDEKQALKPKVDVDSEIKRIEEQLNGPFQISGVLNDILNVMGKGFNYHRIAICIKQVGTNDIAVRHGLGDGIDTLIRDFKFTLRKAEDIFHLCLLREKDYSIHDIDDPKFKALVPDWYRTLNLAKSFDLFSLVIDHVPLGFFYADRDAVIDHVPFDQQKHMKKLRSLAEKAIRIKKGTA